MSSRPSLPSDPAAERAALLDRLGSSGPFGFGASSLGNLYREVDDAQAHAAVDAAWRQGVRYFDTAPFYGFGLSEKRLGDALRSRPRDQFLLSTKAGRLLIPGAPGGERQGFRSPMPFDAIYDYSYAGVMRSFEASLGRLGLSRIDILLLHDLGRATHGDGHGHWFEQAVKGGFRALEDLRAQGAVAAIGLGVNETAVCADSLNFVDLDLFLLAGRFTLIDQSGAAFLDLCRQRDIGVVTAGVFNSGILATGADSADAFYDYAPASDAVRKRVAAIEQVCRSFGVPLAAAAFRFAAAHPGSTLSLVGARSAEQVDQAISCARAPIPPALWTSLQDEGLIAADSPLPNG